MTTLTLTKHHGLGNDFLVVFDPAVNDLPALARELCDRRRGIGADGLLVGSAIADFDARMVLYNADGSRAEMSGNGIRCFAQAVAERAGRPSSLRILTDAGSREVSIIRGARSDTVEVVVDMGEVSLLPEPADWAQLHCDPLRPVLHLSLGNPHSVVGVDDVHSIDLELLGQVVPYVNLEIVESGPEPGAITMRVHERGAGITAACGTGACASAWAAHEWGMVAADTHEVVVHMDGGSARVRMHQPSAGRVTLVGPAQFVGTIVVAVSAPAADGR